MKFAFGSPITPTGQIYGRVVSLYAPCRNRTYNLMIKSQIRRSLLALPSCVEPTSDAAYHLKVVPQTSRREPEASPLSPPSYHPVGESEEREK